jgi:hypothetical protein
MSAGELLKDIVSNGIALDLFDAEEVLALDELVGENAEVDPMSGTDNRSI